MSDTLKLNTEVEILKGPHKGERAFVNRILPRSYQLVLRDTLDEVLEYHWMVRALDLSLGDLEGEFEIVESFHGLYVYHESGHTTGAGDGTETTHADLAEDARSDPVSFREAFGPGDDWRKCEACGQWVDHGYHKVRLGDPPKWAWVCGPCYPTLRGYTTAEGKRRLYPEGQATFLHGILTITFQGRSIGLDLEGADWDLFEVLEYIRRRRGFYVNLEAYMIKR